MDCNCVGRKTCIEDIFVKDNICCIGDYLHISQLGMNEEEKKKKINIEIIVLILKVHLIPKIVSKMYIILKFIDYNLFVVTKLTLMPCHLPLSTC